MTDLLAALAIVVALLVWREVANSRRIADLERQLTAALQARSGVALNGKPKPERPRERPEERVDPYLVP